MSTDHEIISRILNGERAHFRELYNRHIQYLMLTAFRYIKRREVAEDLVQESLIKIFNKLSQFDAEKGKFRSWAKKIVINTCLEFLRKKSIIQYVEDFREIHLTNSVREVALENLELEDLTKVIQSLPTGYRAVFNMYIIDGYSHKEIAQKFSISESTSKTQLLKAKKALRLNIQKEEITFVRAYA